MFVFSETRSGAEALDVPGPNFLQLQEVTLYGVTGEQLPIVQARRGPSAAGRSRPKYSTIGRTQPQPATVGRSRLHLANGSRRQASAGKRQQAGIIQQAVTVAP